MVKKQRSNATIGINYGGQSARRKPTSAGIGGLVYIFGGCVLSALFDSDTVIIAWWALLMVVSMVVFAWLKWLRRDKEG